MKGFKGRGILDVLGRKTIIIGLILLIISLSIATVVLLFQSSKVEQVEQVVYTEKGSIDYFVYLKENDFYGTNCLGKDRQYIANLIDYVDANFKYELKSTEVNTKYQYTYKIVAEVNVEEQENGNSIYKFSDDIVKEKLLVFNTNKKLKIDELVRIDYNKYNNVIKEFIDIYHLNEINPNLTVKMYVNVAGVTTSTAPVSSLVIPLTTKTVAMDMQTNTVNATDTSVYKEIANKNQLYIAILLSILLIALIFELVVFINNTKDDLAIYNTKVRKILLNYDSYIQRIDNELKFDGYQQIEMKTFDDLLQIRDTISQPILMIEKNDGKENDFFIPSKENVVYIYKMKLEDFQK